MEGGGGKGEGGREREQTILIPIDPLLCRYRSDPILSSLLLCLQHWLCKYHTVDPITSANKLSVHLETAVIGVGKMVVNKTYPYSCLLELSFRLIRKSYHSNAYSVIGTF
jgi:hypothetical protein